MALFKILKGPESGLPEAKHEGWAYVTNEGNFYVDISDSVRVKINENADYAEQATYDSSNQKITDTYVKDVILNNHTSAPYYTLRLGNGALKDVDGNGADQVLLPVASATAAGVITTGTQTLTGAKTIDANGSLTVVKAGGFQYSGIQEGTSAGARPIWYSHASQVGTPCIGAELLYDPASTEAWTNYDTTSTAEAHGLLSVPRLKGIAFQALQDDRGQIIKNTYIKEITLPKDESIIAGSLSNPYLRYVLGDGATITKIALPAADGKNGGGIVTGAAQSISGVKTFIAQITADKGLYSKENIVTDKQFESKIATGTAPFKVASTTVVENLNADTVDGMHASNAGFTFENSSTTILPTQRAIWTSFNSLLQGAHALVYRGLIDPTNNSTVPTKPSVGDVYIISAEGTFNSVYCEPGDMAIYYAGGWDIVQVNIDGAVRIKGGGAAATAHTTENAIARFDNTTGRVIKNSAITITDAGHMLPQKVNASDATTKHNIGSSDNTWGTIYGTNFTGLSNQATHDSQGQVIHDTYIKTIEYVRDNDVKTGSENNPYLRFYKGSGADPTYLQIPAAGSQLGGILTAGAQTISGAKTLDSTDGSLTIPKLDSFIYSGLNTDTAASSSTNLKYIWFSNSGGVPKKNGSLTVNPACTTAWTSYSPAKSTYVELTVDRVNGIAKQAYADDSGQIINDTYIKTIVFVKDNAKISGSLSNPYLQYTLGNDSTITKLAMPAADATGGGIVTAAAQTIAGKKTFTGGVEFTNADFNYSGIENATSNAARSVWFADSARVGKPVWNANFTFNPAASVKWDHDSSNVSVGLLTVSRMEGLARRAAEDRQGYVIDKTYLVDVILNTSATAPYYTLRLGNQTLKDTDGTTGADKVNIPVASTTQAGVITADTTNTQTITGPKKMDSNGSLEITKANGFTYSGLQADTAAGTTKYIWFSTTGGVPKYNTKLAFNPSCTTKWDNYDTNTTATAHTELTVDRVNGIAKQALEDHQGFAIDNYYIHSISFVADDSAISGSVSNPYLKYIMGNGSDNTKIALPAASASQGGILNTAAQAIKGKKTFNDGIAAKLSATDTSGTYYPWFSTISSNIGTPAYDTGLSYNPSTNVLTTTTFKGALDGLAAQATADASNQIISATYIKDITYDSYKFTVKLGNGTTLRTISPLFAASASCGGAATSAVKLATARTISLTGAVTGSTSFDGSGNVSIATTSKQSGIYYVDGTSSTTAGTWIGTNTDIPSLTTGLTIAYKIGIAGASTTTLNLTTAAGASGAKTVKRNDSNLTTHVPVNAVILLTYDGTCWRWADYDSNDKVKMTVTTTNAEYPLLASATASRTATATEAARFASAVTLNPSTSTITAKTFNGNAKNGIYFVTGTGSTAGTWLGTNTDIPSLFTGLTIAYKISIAGASTTTLDLTTAAGASGAKTVKRNASNLTTHLPVGTVVLLTYDGTAWCWADYDSNTNTQMRVYRQTSGYNGDYPILVSRTALSSIGTAGSDGTYTAVYGVVGQNGTYTPTINPHTGVVKIKATTASSSKTTGALIVSGGIGAAGNIYATKVYGAVWNDYAEYRAQKETVEPGYCVASTNDGKVYKTTEKFQACDGIVSDTYGFSIGETEKCKTPLAVAGRVLAYCEGSKYDYHSGDTVCAGPNGKIVKMTREEIKEYPDRIVGIVSEIPEYETWGSGNVPVNGRIWIKVR